MAHEKKTVAEELAATRAKIALLGTLNTAIKAKKEEIDSLSKKIAEAKAAHQKSLEIKKALKAIQAQQAHLKNESEKLQQQLNTTSPQSDVKLRLLSPLPKPAGIKDYLWLMPGKAGSFFIRGVVMKCMGYDTSLTHILIDSACGAAHMTNNQYHMDTISSALSDYFIGDKKATSEETEPVGAEKDPTAATTATEQTSSDAALEATQVAKPTPTLLFTAGKVASNAVISAAITVGLSKLSTLTKAAFKPK